MPSDAYRDLVHRRPPSDLAERLAEVLAKSEKAARDAKTAAAASDDGAEPIAPSPEDEATDAPSPDQQTEPPSPPPGNDRDDPPA